LSWTVTHISGGFFSGSKASLDSWLNLYTKTHDYLLANKKFVGKDRLVMDATALTYKYIAMVFRYTRSQWIVLC
jgi:hypothetical protein